MDGYSRLSNTLSLSNNITLFKHPIVHYFPYETREKDEAQKQTTQENTTRKTTIKENTQKSFSIKIKHNFFSQFLNKNYSAHKSDFDWTKLPGARLLKIAQ